MKIAYIEASWHYDIVQNAHAWFEEALNNYDFWEQPIIKTFTVPGSLEIPMLSQRIIDRWDFDYIIWVWLVVDWWIYEHKFVGNAILQWLVKISTESRTPIFSVILTPQNFDENSPADIKKFASHFVTKWKEAWNALIQMYETLKQLENIKK